MKRLIERASRQNISLAAVFLIGLVCSAAAQPKSDFEIVKSFQAKYKVIKEAIREAKTVQECAEINANIADLEKEYAADTTLLNNALYPHKYDDEINNVQVDLQMTQSKFGIIESQVNRISELEFQVRTLSGKIDSLTNANSKLMASLEVMANALVKNKTMIDSLNRIISRLRQGLRARDAAIFALVDSMFMQYGTNLQTLPENQKGMLIGKMRRHNVVGAIRQAAEQNLKFLETTELTGNDLVQMLKEQHKFGSYWKGLGPRLATLYVNSRDREREVANIDTLISRWGRKADSTLWAGLYKEFTDNKIPVDTFSNAREFVTSLSNYFDTQGGNLKVSGTERVSRLRYFLNHVWYPSINSQWLPMLVNEGVLTQAQDNQLQNELMAWKEASKPSYTLLYIVIILVLAAVLVFFLRRRKSIPPSQFPSQN